MTQASAGIAASFATATMTPRATTIVASSIAGPETGTTRAPRMAKYLGSPPCAKITAGASTNKIANMTPTNAGELGRANPKRPPHPLVEKDKDNPEQTTG